MRRAACSFTTRCLDGASCPPFILSFESQSVAGGLTTFRFAEIKASENLLLSTIKATQSTNSTLSHTPENHAIVRRRARPQIFAMFERIGERNKCGERGSRIIRSPSAVTVRRSNVDQAKFNKMHEQIDCWKNRIFIPAVKCKNVCLISATKIRFDVILLMARNYSQTEQKLYL